MPWWAPGDAANPNVGKYLQEGLPFGHCSMLGGFSATPCYNPTGGGRGVVQCALGPDHVLHLLRAGHCWTRTRYRLYVRCFYKIFYISLDAGTSVRTDVEPWLSERVRMSGQNCRSVSVWSVDSCQMRCQNVGSGHNTDTVTQPRSGSGLLLLDNRSDVRADQLLEQRSAMVSHSSFSHQPRSAKRFLSGPMMQLLSSILINLSEQVNNHASQYRHRKKCRRLMEFVSIVMRLYGLSY